MILTESKRLLPTETNQRVGVFRRVSSTYPRRYTRVPTRVCVGYTRGYSGTDQTTRFGTRVPHRLRTVLGYATGLILGWPTGLVLRYHTGWYSGTSHVGTRVPPMLVPGYLPSSVLGYSAAMVPVYIRTGSVFGYPTGLVLGYPRVYMYLIQLSC